MPVSPACSCSRLQTRIRDTRSSLRGRDARCEERCGKPRRKARVSRCAGRSRSARTYPGSPRGPRGSCWPRTRCTPRRCPPLRLRRPPQVLPRPEVPRSRCTFRTAREPKGPHGTHRRQSLDRVSPPRRLGTGPRRDRRATRNSARDHRMAARQRWRTGWTGSCTPERRLPPARPARARTMSCEHRA